MKTVIRNSYTPKIGDYCETIVVDKETENAYIFDCDGVFTPMPQPVDVEKILEEAAEYTDETVAPLKEKLDTIEEGAQVNVIEHVLKNGSELTITNKTVNVTVPIKTSDLTNDGSDGTDTYVESAVLDDYYTKTETDTQIGYETSAREIADSGLQEQIDAIVASSDVVDIVGTYAALQAYDTSKLHDNDIIKVLTDETRDDATTYYRWTNSTWTYIGAEGPFYTKAESDALFTPMTRTINGKALSSDVTLTASDVGALPDSTVIPTVNDATLTIQKNGTTVQTFTANQASDVVANIVVPTDTSDLTNGAGFITSAALPTKTSELTNDGEDGTDTYAEMGDLPTKTSDLQNDGADGTSTYVETADLATVATTGDYDDLLNKPTIPTVNNATLTIQKNGTAIDTFTANASVDKTINVTVPTDTSDLTNNAGFITSAALSNYYTKSETYTQNEVNGLINSLSIPTKTSDLVNDSGFLTSIPIASANDLGGVKIGTGLSIASDGTVSVTSAGSVAWNDITGKPTDVSYWNNDAGYITSASIPTNVSAFTNDAGYITSAAIPTNVSAFTNDAGYLTSSALSNYYTKSETYTQSEVNSLINAITVPTKTSDLTNDGSDGASTYIEADELATVATSGSYNDLLNKPAIPSYSDFTGATSSTAGAHGLVPAPAAGDEGKFLQGDGTWATVSTGQTYTAGNGIDIDANNEISVDTTVVATQTDLSGKQDALTAGDAIDITNNVISVEADSALDVSSTKPVQNSVVTAAINGKQDTLTAGSNIQINNNTISATDTTYSDFTGATSQIAGAHGLVPAPTTSDPDKFLKGDGTWGTPPGATYTAGTGIDITGNTVSVDTSVIAELSDLPTKTSELTNDGADGTSTYVEADDLATVATSGSYTDLSNKPTIPAAQVNSDWNSTSGLSEILNKPTLAAVATSGSYNDLTDTPTIPTVNNGTLTIKKNGTNVQTFTANQSGNATADITVDYIKTADNISPTADTTAAWNAALGGRNCAYYTWYTSSNKFTHQPSQYGMLETIKNGTDVYQRWHAQPSGPILYRSGNTSGWSSPSDGSWNTVATTAQIPTVNDATLTIQKNGTTVGTFTANASSNSTVDIAVPTATSELTNDSGFITGYTAGDHINISNDTISATGYVHSENPVSIVNPSATVSGSNITDGSITAAKFATGATLQLTLSTTDIGEGAPLAANTLYGVYE